PVRGPLRALRQGWYLVCRPLLEKKNAGGVLGADRAIDASPMQIELHASDLRLRPSDVSVPAGRFLVIRFVNDDAVFHDWVVEGLANVDANARPGQVQQIRVRLDRPGSYEIRCTVDGHATAGMTGRLVVTP